ncbi:unnamed protein product, partial [Ectocarpus sp. 12 AP-2014]
LLRCSPQAAGGGDSRRQQQQRRLHWPSACAHQQQQRRRRHLALVLVDAGVHAREQERWRPAHVEDRYEGHRSRRQECVRVDAQARSRRRRHTASSGNNSD